MYATGYQPELQLDLPGVMCLETVVRWWVSIGMNPTTALCNSLSKSDVLYCRCFALGNASIQQSAVSKLPPTSFCKKRLKNVTMF